MNSPGDGKTITENMQCLLEDFFFIGASEYLSLFPESGSVQMTRPFEVPYYMIRNCLCAGSVAQVIMPQGKNGTGQTLILKESFNYQHDKNTLAFTVSDALLHVDKNEPEFLDEAVPLYPTWSLGNLWHWFFDSMPKILTMETAGYRGPYIVNASSSVCVEGLELMGIGPERIIDRAKPHFIKRAFIPQVINYSALHTKYSRLLLALRERLLEVAGPQKGEKRCFIRRIGTRRLLNENELLDALGAYDIEVLVPEKHSLREQIAFMSNVCLTLSPHGANTTLAFFQKHKSVLMEFFGHDYIHNTCNLPAINMLKLLYIPVTQTVLSREPIGRASASEAELNDYTINVELVVSILKNIASVTYKL